MPRGGAWAGVVGACALLATALSPTATAAQQEGDLDGRFDTINGQDLAGAGVVRNEVRLRLSATELAGEMHIAADSTFDFGGQPEDTCFFFDFDLNASPVPVQVAPSGAVTVEGPVGLVVGNSDAACAAGPPVRTAGRPATVTAVVADDEITGTVNTEEFSAAFSATGSLRSPGSAEGGGGGEQGQTGTLFDDLPDGNVLIDTQLVDTSILNEVIRLSGCQGRGAALPARCSNLLSDGIQLVTEFAGEFRQPRLSQLAGVSLLSRLRTPDGVLLMPTVARLTPTLVALVVAAEEGDASAAAALQRLMNLSIAMDLGAR